MSSTRKHALATCHHQHGGSRHLHERHHRASRPSCVSYLTPKHRGARTTVRRTPGLPVSTMLRDAQKCASVTEQASASADRPLRHLTDCAEVCPAHTRAARTMCDSVGMFACSRGSLQTRGEASSIWLRKVQFLVKARLVLQKNLYPSGQP